MNLLTKLASPFTGGAAAGRISPAAPVAPVGTGSNAVEVANVAHRGASAYTPENTLAAVHKGIAMGGDLIEVDVQRTKDGELVLIHDTNLIRTTDAERLFPGRAPWNVSDFTYAEILQLDAGSWKSSEYEGEKIPTLAEAVEVIRQSRSGLLLEIKAPELYPGIEADVAATMRTFPGYIESAVAGHRLVVESFNFASMRLYRELEPTVTVGLLGRPTLEQLPELATWADQVNPQHRSVDATYVAAVHRAGMDCLVWTVNSVANMNRAIDIGVNGVITNRPDILEQVLRDRGTEVA
ncbi:MAG: glycerophosphodiester phosphodiesterase [Nocardioidaceae bacterium]